VRQAPAGKLAIEVDTGGRHAGIYCGSTMSKSDDIRALARTRDFPLSRGLIPRPSSP